jgi:hypothetical protein
MRKLILTLFLASASLVSFAQSTVKTIRVATPASAFSESIPQGTQVVVLSTNVVYTATVGIVSTTVISAAITAGSLITVTDTTVSTTVVEEELTADDPTYSKVLTAAVFGQHDGDGVLSNNQIVKVFVNGTLLPSGSYTVEITASATTPVNTLAIIAPLYQYDAVQIIYDTLN